MNSQAALDKILNYESDIAIFGSNEITNQLANQLHFRDICQNEFKFVAAPNHKYANKEIPLEDT